MADKWGLFLCDCRRTLPLDPERLTLPIAPSILSFATDPEREIPEFAARAGAERLDRILIGCCAPPSLFKDALGADGSRGPKLHFVNLKEFCFQVHADKEQAHAKAYRLLRAAMETAETESEPAYNPLVVGGRLLIASDSLPPAMQLAERLRDIVQPIFVISSDSQDPSLNVPPGGLLFRGKLLKVSGRLSDFLAVIENPEQSENPRQEIKADQVVIISRNGLPDVKPRTGCHLVINSGEADLDPLAERIRDLTGEFVKPVHVDYNADICAGGSADKEACGICMTACPYDAISRDPQNHLRMQVDHLACEGCGACVSACPTTSLRFTDPSPQALYRKLAALLAPLPSRRNGDSQIVLFHCGEQGRRALEEAGRRSLQYPAQVLPIEVPCLRYVSEANMLSAFRLGAAGVGLLGCESCPHGERDLLFQKIDFCRLALTAFDLGAERLRLMTATDGGESETITALSNFAATLDPAPIRCDGRPPAHWGNRDVIMEAIAAFIDQTGKEPGRRTFDAPYPFAFADVKESGCTMCRSCVNICPVHAFRLDESAQSLQFKHLACVACGLCEKVCPEDVITLKQEIFFDQGALDYQTVVQDNVVACAKCGKPYINRKALEAVEARLFSLESLLDTFSGNRRSLLRMCPDCRAIDAMAEVDKGWKP